MIDIPTGWKLCDPDHIVTEKDLIWSDYRGDFTPPYDFEIGKRVEDLYYTNCPIIQKTHQEEALLPELNIEAPIPECKPVEEQDSRFKPSPKLLQPDPPPRYDEVFEAGVQALEMQDKLVTIRSIFTYMFSLSNRHEVEVEKRSTNSFFLKLANLDRPDKLDMILLYSENEEEFKNLLSELIEGLIEIKSKL